MRSSISQLDELLDTPLSVLNDGFVRVVDYMGGDESIVQAARVSYGSGTKKIREDRGLIRYLLRHHHTTPFEMCEIKLHVRVPMDCWRQWIRHRTANVNEYSTRYSVAIDSLQTTLKSEWRMQSSVNKQGSGEKLDDVVGSYLSEKEGSFHSHAKELYLERLDLGVAREQARKDLPLSTYTEAYWKIDLHNMLHFLHLRMDSHAQSEIRQYAEVIGNEIVAKWCPLTWEAFNDYRRHAMSLSTHEVEIVRLMLNNDSEAALTFAIAEGLLTRRNGKLEGSRELVEINEKLRRFNIDSPFTDL